MTETLSPALPADIERQVHEVLEAACDRELSLATAESCTGGMLASLLTDVQGASHAFDRGFVVYTDEAKNEMLGVSLLLCQQNGAVSRRVAIALAEGAVARSEAQIAVGITGFAGPASGDAEEGLVHFACAREGHETRHREEHFGPIGRGPVRLACMGVALSMLKDMIEA